MILVVILSILSIYHSTQVLVVDASKQYDKKIFCIYSTKSAGNFDGGGFGYYQVDNIDEKYCTHLIYTYLGVGFDGKIKSLTPKLDFEENGGIGNLKNFNNKKNLNQNLKTIVAIGGWDHTENSKRYSELFRDKKIQQNFVASAINFLIKYNFDGLALHWAYPSLNGGDPKIDKFTFTSLLKLLKIELSRMRFIVVAICHGLNSKIPQSYNVKEISQNVDYIYVNSYDFYGKWSQHIGISSALYLHPREIDGDLSVDSAINGWVNSGAQSEKIIMGIPLFGRIFTLKYTNQTEPGSAYIGVGHKEFMSYIEMCQKFIIESWTIKWEENQKNPYAFKGNQWVSFENERSLEIKSKYVLNRNLAGVAVAHLADDDFQEVCGEKYHMFKVLNSFLRNESGGNNESDYNFVYNFNVFKRRLKDKHVTKCIYHKSGNIQMN